ncbi:hypothetical protein [Nonomuraea sp. NPDC049141]|uniref:hypothetical protein n=1 Tax=unclassified Nonomuraea TaxID=2593643 RepID=UPI003405400E
MSTPSPQHRKPTSSLFQRPSPTKQRPGVRLPDVLLRRTGRGKVAAQYHTARFRLVPSLAKVLNVPTPALRKPGTVWVELPRPAAGTQTPGHAKIGYARASTVRQSLQTQLDSLNGVTVVLAENPTNPPVTSGFFEIPGTLVIVCHCGRSHHRRVRGREAVAEYGRKGQWRL